MHCPNCEGKMKHKHKEQWVYPLSLGCEADYPELRVEDKYKCKECDITCKNGEWKVPKEYRPTKKQENTIKFINDVLDKNIEPITKHQCWKDINKYFDKAKKEDKKIRKEFEEFETGGIMDEWIDDNLYEIYDEMF